METEENKIFISNMGGGGRKDKMGQFYPCWSGGYEREVKGSIEKLLGLINIGRVPSPSWAPANGRVGPPRG